MIEPAGIATPIWRKSLAVAERTAESLPQSAFDLYGPLISTQRARVEQSDRNGIPPRYVVRAVVHALTSPRPRNRYLIGRRAVLGEVLRLVPDGLRERLILRQLHN
jgi:hypothetical protein